MTSDEIMLQIDKNCKPPIEEPDEKPKNCYNKFEEYFVTRKFSDFTIRHCEKQHKVHKYILASQSPVFESIFSDDDGGNTAIYHKIKNFGKNMFGSFFAIFLLWMVAVS